MKWEMRPARDLGLPFVARLRAHQREQGLVGTVGHALWLTAIRAYLRAAHAFTVIGRDNIPANAPFVMVANHSSHLDALALSAALPRSAAARSVALAAGDAFFGSVVRAMFAVTALNALPIWRTDTSAADLKLLRHRLAADRLIFLLFPEGTRSRTGAMSAFRPGLGAFVANSGIPVLPCYLDGTHMSWPPSRRAPRPGRITLSIGPPLTFERVANDRQGWKAVASAVEAAVRALAPG